MSGGLKVMVVGAERLVVVVGAGGGGTVVGAGNGPTLNFDAATDTESSGVRKEVHRPSFPGS